MLKRLLRHTHRMTMPASHFNRQKNKLTDDVICTHLVLSPSPSVLTVLSMALTDVFAHHQWWKWVVQSHRTPHQQPLKAFFPGVRHNSFRIFDVRHNSFRIFDVLSLFLLLLFFWFFFPPLPLSWWRSMKLKRYANYFVGTVGENRVNNHKNVI